MEFAVLGWPDDGPTLRLDHRRFSYAGKFVMSNSGKAVVRDAGEVVAAASFNEDRTDPARMWVRYLTVRADRRGKGIGPRLAGALRERILDRGYERVSIAVNNPFAYQALYRAGFAYRGRETGIAELVLCHPAERTTRAYQSGLETFAARSDLSDEELAFLARKRDADPPAPVDVPVEWTPTE